jgi:hypothetical protein
MNVHGMMNDVKVAATVAMGAMGTGLGAILDVIPDDIAKLASLVAIVLTSVLVRNHWRNGKKIDLENEKLQLEVNAMSAREKEREALAADRRLRGLPVRRGEDQVTIPRSKG